MKLKRYRACLLVAALGALTCMSALAKDKPNKPNNAHRYRQVNLVSDLPGIAAIQDPNLVNAWGVSFGPTSPFWVSSTETGRAVVYAVTNDSSGVAQVSKQPLEVTIPGEGNVTGQVFNNTAGFNGDLFLFVSEDGTISGWRGDLGTTAEVLATRPGAVYKGVTLATSSGGTVLLAANFAEGTIDVYGPNLALLGQFTDTNAPAAYAPFNVQSVAGKIYVTFAEQNDEKEDEVAGAGRGLIDVFNAQTGAFRRFATGSRAGGHLRTINAPWGVVLAPDTFGVHANQILIGNFGSGTIMAFSAQGKYRGLLRNARNRPITIDGLWALTTGNGGRAGVPDRLYFTAGPDEETHGLFGSIEPVTNR